MSIESLQAFYNEAQVAAAPGVTLRLVVNFRTIDLIEGLLGRGMDDLLGELATSTTLMGKFLWAMTREHHHELTLDQIAGVMFSPDYGAAVAATLGDLVRRSFNVGDPAGEEGDEQRSRPPRAKAKRSAGASRASSGNGSPPGSNRQASGKKRRARSSR